MKKAFQIAIVLLAVLVGVILALDLHHALLSATQAFNDADHTILQLDSVASNASATTDKINLSIDAQLREFQKTQAALRLAITFTDKNLNDPITGVLPQARQTLKDSDVNLFAVSQSAQGVLGNLRDDATGLRPVLSNFAEAGQAATDDLSDPSIKATLANMNRTTFEVAGVATDAHTETTLLVGKTQDAFKPKNKALTILEMLVGNTVTGAELFYYLRH